MKNSTEESTGVSKSGKKVEVELFRVTLVDQLQIVRKGRRLVANWDKVKWKDCIKIGLAISGPVSATLGIEQDKITHNEEIQEIENGYGLASVVFYTDDGQIQIDSNIQKQLDGVISCFISYVFRENGKNIDIFDDNLAQADFELIVREHATNFLRENGGGKIGTPVQVTSTSFNKVCSGSFSPKTIVHPQKNVVKVLVGKVISMMCEKAEFVVKPALKDPTTIAYNKNIFFREVKELLGEPITGTFSAHEAMDPQGRIFLVLNSIDARHVDSGTLI